jgi:hypothetical protein
MNHEVVCERCGWRGQRAYITLDDPLARREGFGPCRCGGTLRRVKLRDPHHHALPRRGGRRLREKS